MDVGNGVGEDNEEIRERIWHQEEEIEENNEKRGGGNHHAEKGKRDLADGKIDHQNKANNEDIENEEMKTLKIRQTKASSLRKIKTLKWGQ